MTEGYSFLRFLFTKYSESEYLTEVWTPINEVLKQFLQNSSENLKPMSYQSIYCLIYKSTCKGYKERLFDDFKKVIIEHCQNLKSQLDENLKVMMDERSNTLMNIYILQFINYLHQYLRSIEAIVPLFHYLDVVYIKPKMRSTIQQELLILYKTIIIESHINYIFSALQQLMNTPNSASKETIGLLLQMTNDITPESAIKQRALFERYCDGEDVFKDVFNQEEMITPTPRTATKRSVDELPGEEDQPSAKRPMYMIKSPHSDN